MSDLAAARAAKTRLETTLDAIPGIAAVGLTQSDGGSWAIRVNLTADTPAARYGLPDQVDGVPVTIATTGRATAQEQP